VQLRIEKAIYGGAGLARLEGKAIFVPFALPGETVEAHIAEESRGYATAELDAVVEASPARLAPPCPYFGACGGCHYQHANYAAQVEMKRAILREALERAHIRQIPEIEALTGDPFGYRNRVRLHVQNNPFSLCYKKRGARENLPVATCPIGAPALQRAIEKLNSDGNDLKIGMWAEEIELFTNGDESALLAGFWPARPATEAQRLLTNLWPRLQQLLPTLRGAVAFSVEKGRQPSRLLVQTGDASFAYRVGAQEYRVSPGSFFQVNRFLIEPLVELVTGNASGTAAWDLYAGVGLFSAPLSNKFADMTAVESAARSVRDLRENLRSGEPNRKTRVVAADTAAFLRRAVDSHTPAPDLVIVDPPRAGVGSAAASALGKLRPPRITYVSCDPATLSRDLAALQEYGYSLSRIHLVDLFPQTFHLESVTQLTLH
jgi:23S rRNA (uracil1939-C5)-methyltransferase